MAQAPTVATVGLRALLRDVKRMCATAGPLYKALAAAGKQAATPVAERAAGDYPDTSGALAATVRVSGTKSGATVRVGGISGVNYAGPVDFGGWPVGREYVATGRYLFPAARSLAQVAAEVYTQAAQQAFDSFDWTNETTNAGSVHT